MSNRAILKELKELGDPNDHSCYVCFDDWKWGRKACWCRQYREILIQLERLRSVGNG